MCSIHCFHSTNVLWQLTELLSGWLFCNCFLFIIYRDLSLKSIARSVRGRQIGRCGGGPTVGFYGGGPSLSDGVVEREIDGSGWPTWHCQRRTSSRCRWLTSGPGSPPDGKEKTGPGWSLFFFYLGRRPTRTLRCGHFVLAADACELMMHRWDQSANDGLLWQSRTGSVGSRIVKCCWMEASGVVRVWWVIAFAFCDLLLCLVVVVVVRLRLKPS